MTKLRGLGQFTCAAARTACIVLLFCAVTAIASRAKTTFKTLVNFDGTNGANPALMSLVQGTDGNLYGTTVYGGANSAGTVFKMTAGGTLTTLYSFCSQENCTDGSNPNASLVQVANGNFYGTTVYGGANAGGTVFRITAGGTLTTLYSFCSQGHCADGAYPAAGLVQAANGDFYGTTVYGGQYGYGAVFKITAGGALTTLHSFDGTDGEYPYAGLVQATDGNFYGTTWAGGANDNCTPYGCGTVFAIAPAGTLTTLHSFDATDGAEPNAGLAQATNGDFYGTTTSGGVGPGTIFKITAGGTLTTLHDFNVTDGSVPCAGLVQATDRNFYGTTLHGGNSDNCDGGCGTIFKIRPRGKLTTLHSFDGNDGYYPYGGLLQATNGKFYGTTCGGNNTYCNVAGYGTVFSLGVGLGPFVATRPTSGKVGTKVVILGNKLTGTTRVTFNGTAANFRVISKSEITTTVPTGATTGTVEVATPKKLLNSNVVFRVVQ